MENKLDYTINENVVDNIDKYLDEDGNISFENFLKYCKEELSPYMMDIVEDDDEEESDCIIIDINSK